MAGFEFSTRFFRLGHARLNRRMSVDHRCVAHWLMPDVPVDDTALQTRARAWVLRYFARRAALDADELTQKFFDEFHADLQRERVGKLQPDKEVKVRVMGTPKRVIVFVPL